MRHKPTPDEQSLSREQLLKQYQLPVGPEPEVLRRAPAFTGEKNEPIEPQEPPSHFSLHQLMGIILAACLLMVPAQMMHPAVYAGFMGGIALFFLGLMLLLGLRGSLVWAVFLSLLMVYATASLTAALMH
jgi:hypothetical protein